jgi:hypothetical protein
MIEAVPEQRPAGAEFRPKRPLPPDFHEGDALLRADWIGTSVFTVTAVSAALVEVVRGPAAVASLALFGVGTVVFLWAYVIAIGRSRTDAIGMGGLFFLAGSAPRRVQRSFMVALAVQVVVGVATASARPFTSLAFGVLVPMYGLGLAGFWAARHGTFPARGEA